MFAEAINTEAHLESFISLASTAGINVDETILEIETNIHWMSVKASEIANWVAIENGASMSVKASLLTVITFIFVILLQ